MSYDKTYKVFDLIKVGLSHYIATHHLVAAWNQGLYLDTAGQIEIKGPWQSYLTHWKPSAYISAGQAATEL